MCPRASAKLPSGRSSRLHRAAAAASFLETLKAEATHSESGRSRGPPTAFGGFSCFSAESSVFTVQEGDVAWRSEQAFVFVKVVTSIAVSFTSGLLIPDPGGPHPSSMLPSGGSKRLKVQACRGGRKHRMTARLNALHQREVLQQFKLRSGPRSLTDPDVFKPRLVTSVAPEHSNLQASTRRQNGSSCKNAHKVLGRGHPQRQHKMQWDSMPLDVRDSSDDLIIDREDEAL